jgi:hypothetical protein
MSHLLRTAESHSASLLVRQPVSSQDVVLSPDNIVLTVSGRSTLDTGSPGIQVEPSLAELEPPAPDRHRATRQATAV